MILGENSGNDPSARTTLDDLFRRTAERRPDALAIADSPDRERHDGVVARRLTYAQADRMVSAIAGRLRRIGLSTDAVVGFQLAHDVESVLLLLGILRAGMIAAPLPLLWRQADGVAALSRIGAKALVTCGRRGNVDYCQLAMQIAADIFPLRYVCGFGPGPGDGVISFDDLFTMETPDPLPAALRENDTNPAAHVAIVTWDVTAEGLVAVARNHVELLAGGLAVFLESEIQPGAVMASASPMSSFGGICATLMPWLLSGGTLALHQPFSPETLAAQVREHACDVMVLPGSLAARFSEARLVGGVNTILAIWRAPERLAGSAVWQHRDIALVDLMMFGELAVIAGRRAEDGMPARLSMGLRRAPHALANSAKIAELIQTPANTLAVRGPMIPHQVFPPGAERSGYPAFRFGPDGFVDTGCTCRIDRETNALVITGSPAGIVSVGGYRFALRDWQTQIERIEAGSTLAALPDGITGHRLAGHASDRAAMRQALTAQGANPLLARAFRDRVA